MFCDARGQRWGFLPVEDACERQVGPSKAGECDRLPTGECIDCTAHGSGENHLDLGRQTIQCSSIQLHKNAVVLGTKLSEFDSKWMTGICS